MRAALRSALLALLVIVALLALPLVAGAAQLAGTMSEMGSPAPASAVAPRPVPFDPARPTAVVVVGAGGAEVSDVLAPYEVLTATGRFNVYTVAPAAGPRPLNGSLDLVPDLTFAQLDARTGGRAPDLVIVPAMPDLGQPTQAPVLAWLRAQAARGALLEGVCVGSGVLASAGLLDGRPATTHWGQVDGFASDYPAVRWVHGRRWVDDGTVVTSGGVLSGIDATLHVVERLVGPAAAVKAAAAVGWPHYAPGRPPPPVVAGYAPSDAALLLNAAFGWSKPRVGVVLTEGVGEIELASVVDAFGGDSSAAHVLVVGVDGGAVRSRHGLTFVPRSALRDAAPQLDRVLVPGADAALASSVPTVDDLTPRYVHARPGFAYDAAVTELADATDVATARWAARAMELPFDGVELHGRSWPWTATLQVLGLSVLGFVVLIAVRGRRARTS